jgi:hypothetical protein
MATRGNHELGYIQTPYGTCELISDREHEPMPQEQAHAAGRAEGEGYLSTLSTFGCVLFEVQDDPAAAWVGESR